MNEKIKTIGQSITRYIIESYPHDYLAAFLSEEMGLDDLVDQILLELVKYAYDNTRVCHFIQRNGALSDSVFY